MSCCEQRRLSFQVHDATIESSSSRARGATNLNFRAKNVRRAAKPHARACANGIPCALVGVVVVRQPEPVYIQARAQRMNEIASSEADESRPEIDPVTLNGPEGALAKRRVSFKEDRDPTAERSIELAPIAEEEGSPPTARDSFSSESDDFHAARLRTRSEVAPSVIERFAITRERKWSITITSLIAAIPGFLLGLTLGYPSNAILDLTGEATELPPEFYFNDRLTSIFAVSDCVLANLILWVYTRSSLCISTLLEKYQLVVVKPHQAWPVHTPTLMHEVGCTEFGLFTHTHCVVSTQLQHCQSVQFMSTDYGSKQRPTYCLADDRISRVNNLSCCVCA